MCYECDIIIQCVMNVILIPERRRVSDALLKVQESVHVSLCPYELSVCNYSLTHYQTLSRHD